MSSIVQAKNKTKTATAIILATALVGAVGFSAGIWYLGKTTDCPPCPACPDCSNCGGDDGEEKDVDLTFQAPEYGSAKYDSGSMSAAGSSANGRHFSVKLNNYTNKGSDPSGDFTIKLYTSLGRHIDGNSRLLGTYTQSSLAPGQSASHEFTGNLPNGGYAIHASYWWIAKLDADDQVKETDEENNIIDQGFAIAR